MSPPEKSVRYTPEEYLKLERQAETKHEYVDGLVYEMAGESLAHSQICINLAREISTQLRGKPCQALSPNMKVLTGEAGLFAYPDLAIVCGQPVFHDNNRDVLLNPKVIIEVLSPSTERYDRGKKFMRYSSALETLTDYILVSQDIPLLEHLERQDDGRWLHALVKGLPTGLYYKHGLYLTSIDCEIRSSEVYDRVEFHPDESGQPLEG